jgi:hypothetical protein
VLAMNWKDRVIAKFVTTVRKTSKIVCVNAFAGKRNDKEIVQLNHIYSKQKKYISFYPDKTRCLTFHTCN